jgi:hypothetical protein
VLKGTLCAYLKPWESPLQCSQSRGALLASRSALAVIIRNSTYSAICHWPPPSHLASHWPMSWPPHFCLKLILLTAAVRKVCIPHGRSKGIARFIQLLHAFLPIALFLIRLYLQLSVQTANRWHYLSQRKGNWIRNIFKLMTLMLNDVKISCRVMWRHVCSTAVLKKELSNSSDIFSVSNTPKRTASPPTIPHCDNFIFWSSVTYFSVKIKGREIKTSNKIFEGDLRAYRVLHCAVMKL